MKLLLLPATLLLAAGGGQDSAALVDGMIERSNALKSFVAEYRVHARSPDGEPDETEVVLRIVYRAPEELVVDFGSEGERLRWVISEGRMSVLMPGQDGGPKKYGVAEEQASVEQARSRIARTFADKFPGLGDVDGSPGLDVYVQFRATPGTSSERPGFQVQAGWGEVGQGKGTLLGWLAELKKSKADLLPEGDFLVWDAAEGIRISLQRDTGFIEKIVVTHEGETRTGLELRNLELNGEIDAAEFQNPKPDSAVEDISESLGMALAIPKLMATRALIYRKIQDAVEADTLEWTGDARMSLRQVLRTYHTEFAPLTSANTIRSIRSRVDGFSLWYQDANKNLFEGDFAGADELEATRAEWEASYQASLDAWVERYSSRVLPEDGEASKVSSEAHAIELEVAGAAYRESVVEPLLDYFTEQMERAKNGELTPAKK